MAEKKMNVIVVGGSLAGLFCAIVLKRLGHTVRVLERSPTPLNDQGAGLMNRVDTQEFLRLYDATDSGGKTIPYTSARILDAEGNDILAIGVSVEMTSWDALYSILRANFLGVGNEYCGAPTSVEGESKEGRYEYGHRVIDLREKDDKVEVDFQDLSGQTHSTLADLVIGADGPSSTVRSILLPGIERKYAGYVAWRGTVPENEASPRSKDTLLNTCSFFYTADSQIISYTIPGDNGVLEPGKRLINWVWYLNYPADSSEFDELMTDVDGKRHRVSLPVGKMRPEILEKQKALAERTLPPQYAEMVCKTAKPFLQCVTDVLAPSCEFFDGKVLLVGDAVAGIRPHTASGNAQAAHAALQLAALFRPANSSTPPISLQEWSSSVMNYARVVQGIGLQMGELSQFRSEMALQAKLGALIAVQRELSGRQWLGN